MCKGNQLLSSTAIAARLCIWKQKKKEKRSKEKLKEKTNYRRTRGDVRVHEAPEKNQP